MIKYLFTKKKHLFDTDRLTNHNRLYNINLSDKLLLQKKLNILHYFVSIS